MESSYIEVAADALTEFVRVTHCNGVDRCTLGTFNDSLSWLETSEYVEPINRALCRQLQLQGGTSLYDSLCSSADYLCINGDKSKRWLIFAVVCSNDNCSIRSVYECRKHLLLEYANKGDVVIVSAGSNIDACTIKEIGFKHFHVASLLSLRNTMVFKASLDTTGSMSSSMDYIVLVETSAYMARKVPQPQQPQAQLQRQMQQQDVQQLRQQQPQRQMRQQDVRQWLQAPPQKQQQPDVQTRLPQMQHEQRQVQQARKRRVTIRVYCISNNAVHPSDKKIFGDFMLDNYQAVDTCWKERGIQFVILVESEHKSIVGLLVIDLYDSDKAHIKVMAVDNNYRRLGLGTKMLVYVARKNMDKNITLNVEFNKPELLRFYCSKGYANLHGVSIDDMVFMLSLNRLKLIATLPFP